jgi:hypothetical protein
MKSFLFWVVILGWTASCSETNEPSTKPNDRRCDPMDAARLTLASGKTFGAATLGIINIAGPYLSATEGWANIGLSVPVEDGFVWSIAVAAIPLDLSDGRASATITDSAIAPGRANLTYWKPSDNGVPGVQPPNGTVDLAIKGTQMVLTVRSSMPEFDGVLEGPLPPVTCSNFDSVRNVFEVDPDFSSPFCQKFKVMADLSRTVGNGGPTTCDD